MSCSASIVIYLVVVLVIFVLKIFNHRVLPEIVICRLCYLERTLLK